MSTYAIHVLQCVYCRKKQRKITELNTCDSSDADEDSDDDESIGNTEFPEYVSCKRIYEILTYCFINSLFVNFGKVYNVQTVS